MKKIVLLQVEGEGAIYKSEIGLALPEDLNTDCQGVNSFEWAPHHLYELDDSEIDGWYYDEYTKKIYHSGGAEYSKTDQCKNIVRSSDENLKLPLVEDFEVRALIQSEISKEVTKCKESPYYFYTNYCEINGEKATTFLSEKNFNKVFG